MYKNMRSIARADKNAGNYFFSDKAMIFWGSVIRDEVFPDGEKRYFITAESQFDPKLPKRYTVRCFDICDKMVRTVFGFQQFETYEEAKEYLEQHLKEGSKIDGN